MDFDGKPWQRLVSLEMTCNACPSSWKGQTEDGRRVYIRYRHGHLSVRLYTGPQEEVVYEDDFGGELDGVLDTETLRKLTGIRVVA
jgi:hypothetical protein